MKPAAATGPAADVAWARALPLLERAAATAQLPAPRLHIVTSISRHPGGNLTAEINASSRRPTIIKLPCTAALDTTEAALKFLITHELGHLTDAVGVWERRRFVLWLITMVLTTALLAALTYSAAAALINGTAASGPNFWLSATLLACLLPLSGVMYCNRQIEYQADAFAANQLGNTTGARQLFAFVDKRRPRQGRIKRFVNRSTRLWDTHPNHHQRLCAMDRLVHD